jgi:hypothetical protein
MAGIHGIPFAQRFAVDGRYSRNLGDSACVRIAAGQRGENVSTMRFVLILHAFPQL